MQYIDNNTQICALFGHPVKHSFSPQIHNSAFAEKNLNYIYTAFDILPEYLETAVEAIRVLNFRGINVTIPHKEKITTCLDKLDSTAELNGAVNTVVNHNDELVGYNTDGSGFIKSLEQDCSFEAKDKVALIIGAGGSARVVGMELAQRGASFIGILNRNYERAYTLAGVLQESTGVKTSVLPWPREEHPVQQEELTRLFCDAHLIVNCTPMGMDGSQRNLPPLPYNLAGPGQIGYDLVYNPAKTRFMERLESSGCTVSNGLGMLLHQGALAFELWTGCDAPLDVMHRALKNCI